MVYPMFSIRDVVIGFDVPFIDQNDNAAVRRFTKFISSTPELPFASKPADFDLYKVGSFDTESGVIKTVSPVTLVVHGSSVANVEI